MSGKSRQRDSSAKPSKKIKLTHQQKGRNNDEDMDITIESQPITSQQSYTTRLTSADLSRYYRTIDGKNDYDSLIRLINLVKPDISLERIELTNKENNYYLSITVRTSEDHEYINKNEILSIKNPNGQTLIKFTVVNKTQSYFIAIKNVSPGLILSNNADAVDECKTKYNLKEIKRKIRPDGQPTNTLIATANDEKSFINLIKNGLIFKNKPYLVEPWIFKPLQCLKCGQIGHKIIECEHEINTCLKCGEDGHETNNCSKTSKDMSIKCINCSKKHFSFSRTCEIIRNEYRKCNRTYAKILKRENLQDANIDRIYKKDDVNEETTCADSETINNMLEAIASEVDTINNKIMEHKSLLNTHSNELSTITNVVIRHEEEIEQFGISITANTNYLVDNMNSFKEFFKELTNNSREFKQTKSIEEQVEDAKNKTTRNNNKTFSSIGKSSITISPLREKTNQTTLDTSSKQTLTLTERLKQIAKKHQQQ